MSRDDDSPIVKGVEDEPIPLAVMGAPHILLWMAGCFAIAALASCHGRTPSVGGGPLCEALHLCAPATAAPTTILIGCDVTADSPCTEETLLAAVGEAVTRIAERPGSKLEIAALTNDVGTTRIVVDETVPSRHGQSSSMKAALATRFREETNLAVRRAFAAYWEAPRGTGSPLFDDLGKLAMLDRSDGAHELVLVTDGRVVDHTLDSECGRHLPREALIDRALTRRGVLGHDALHGVTVTLVGMDARATTRPHCPVQVGREVELRHLWEHVLTGAGATRVTFTPLTDQGGAR